MKVSANALYVVIPAKAGLRRQDAGANSEAGPEGTLQERRVIQFASQWKEQIKMDSRSRGNDDLKKVGLRKPLMQLFHRH
jgi:hypothetical protein